MTKVRANVANFKSEVDLENGTRRIVETASTSLTRKYGSNITIDHKVEDLVLFASNAILNKATDIKIRNICYAIIDKENSCVQIKSLMFSEDGTSSSTNKVISTKSNSINKIATEFLKAITISVIEPIVISDTLFEIKHRGTFDFVGELHQVEDFESVFCYGDLYYKILHHLKQELEENNQGRD